MTSKKILRYTHALGSAWFLLCTLLVMVKALRQAGVEWWIIFSFSGVSAFLLYVVISFYLFAFFRGASESFRYKIEHPLTSSNSYQFFYLMAPFLGTIGAMLGISDPAYFIESWMEIAYATILTTFAVWIVIDPLLGMAETFIPGSRAHRLRRKKAEQQRKIQEQENRHKLLEQIDLDEQRERERLAAELSPLADRLLLVLTDAGSPLAPQLRAVDIGAEAFRLGGLDAMQVLHKMTYDRYRRQLETEPVCDLISQWWHGVGHWRDEPLSDRGRLYGDI